MFYVQWTLQDNMENIGNEKVANQEFPLQINRAEAS